MRDGSKSKPEFGGDERMKGQKFGIKAEGEGEALESW